MLNVVLYSSEDVADWITWYYYYLHHTCIYIISTYIRIVLQHAKNTILTESIVENIEIAKMKLIYSAKIKSIQAIVFMLEWTGWKYIAAQCMFRNVDHLAIPHGSPIWVIVQMLKQRILEHKKGSFLFSQMKISKTAEFKRTKKCFILTEIAKSVIEI